MNWEEASAYVLVAATAWRMLHGWGKNAVKKGDVVLVWGGAGGLGSMAIQIVKAAGGTAIAMVSGEDKFDYCMKLGAKGCINRNEFEHWGMLPHWKDNVGYAKWLKGVRAFGAKIWEVLGEKRAPNLVFEHPGETTIPVSYTHLCYCSLLLRFCDDSCSAQWRRTFYCFWRIHSK